MNKSITFTQPEIDAVLEYLRTAPPVRGASAPLLSAFFKFLEVQELNLHPDCPTCLANEHVAFIRALPRDSRSVFACDNCEGSWPDHWKVQE